MNNKKFYVYQHIFPNGKMYIGITSKIPKNRWENGKGYSKKNQNVMYNAIQKYGWENVEHNILYSDLSLEQAQEKEKELIQLFHTYIHDENCNGYNMTLGGEGSLGHKLSEESKDKIRMANKNIKSENRYQSVKVFCDGVIYNSIKEFSERNKLNRTTVTKWLKGKNKMPKEWYNKNLHIINNCFDIEVQDKNKTDRIVYNGKIFYSQKEFAKFLNISNATVSLWISGKNSIPLEIYEKGIQLLDRQSNFIPRKDYTKKVFYNGKIYNTQRELCDELNVCYQTLNDWLKNKNKMPKEYEEKGLKYI